LPPWVWLRHFTEFRRIAECEDVAALIESPHAAAAGRRGNSDEWRSLPPRVRLRHFTEFRRTPKGENIAAPIEAPTTVAARVRRKRHDVTR
jgi:hypothetical protein